jgi:hypothetical protein
MRKIRRRVSYHYNQVSDRFLDSLDIPTLDLQNLKTLASLRTNCIPVCESQYGKNPMKLWVIRTLAGVHGSRAERTDFDTHGADCYGSWLRAAAVASRTFWQRGIWRIYFLALILSSERAKS